MALKSVEIERPHEPKHAGEFLVAALHATCEACGDGRVHRYTHGDGPGFFQCIRNAASSGIESGYRVKCPHGHGEGFSVGNISAKLP
jgi:uncharacterized protein (DUF983 family)